LTESNVLGWTLQKPYQQGLEPKYLTLVKDQKANHLPVLANLKED